MVISFVVPGAAVGKARHRTGVVYRKGANGNPQPVTTKDGRVLTREYSDDKTLGYEGKVAFAAREAMQGRAPLVDAVGLSIDIDVQVPQSKSQKWLRQALAGEILPTTKPDCSNVLKAIEDGCNSIAFVDDKQIACLVVRKRYTDRAEVRVTIQSLVDEQPQQRALIDEPQHKREPIEQLRNLVPF